VTGWFGNEAPFAFTMPEQSYADSVWRYMGGTPAVAALYQSRAGPKIIGEIGVRKIREKSLVMTQICIDWVDELGMKLNSPRRRDSRRLDQPDRRRCRRAASSTAASSSAITGRAPIRSRRTSTREGDRRSAS
jgi:hypothetical protein